MPPLGFFDHGISFISIHAVPGPVTGLNFAKISATILQISWSEPEVTNGAIQFYDVQVDTISDTVFQASVPGSQKSILVTNLSNNLHVTSVAPSLVPRSHPPFNVTRFSACNVESWVGPGDEAM